MENRRTESEEERTSSKNISADLLDAAGDAVAVLRAQNIQCLQDHQRKRSLQYIRLFFHRETHL
jgi:hypothetical protein